MLAETLADKGKPPAHLGASHWSTRLMAAAGLGDLVRLGGPGSGVSGTSSRTGWRRLGRFSTDPELEATLRDVVGLDLDPPAGAVVVSVDEKSRIQALDRSPQPSRRAVAGIVLQCSQQLFLFAFIFDRSRVELHDLHASRTQPCDQSAGIVTRGLEPE